MVYYNGSKTFILRKLHVHVYIYIYMLTPWKAASQLDLHSLFCSALKGKVTSAAPKVKELHQVAPHRKRSFHQQPKKSLTHPFVGER